MRYQKTPEELSQKVAAGGLAGLEAFDKLAAVDRMVYQRLHGLHTKEKLRFKTNDLHTTLMLSGMSFGVQSLTEGELADFFDHVCSCKEHSVEALRRLRDRTRIKLRSYT